MLDFRSAIDWRGQLRWWRNQNRMSQEWLAGRSGLSRAAIRSYENGARRPSREALDAIIDALGLPADAADRIRTGAGYSASLGGFFEGRLPRLQVSDLKEEIEQIRWPAFIANQSFDVLVPNGALARIFQVNTESEMLAFGERNLLGGITHDELADRLCNWDEVVNFMCGLAKGDPRWSATDAGNIAPWLRRPMEAFLAGNPTRIRRFFEIWQESRPITHRIVQKYRICWLYDGKDCMRFEGRMVVADVWSELHWNEWIPADVETWKLLGRICP